MKKLFISIIVILVLILIGQLIYFNISDKKIASSNIINDITTNNTIEEEKKEVRTDPNITYAEDIIAPINIDALSRTYKGNVKLLALEKQYYKFITTNVADIYDATTGKSINNILQIYDLNTKSINDMNIYSKEDFEEITAQVFNVGTSHTYVSSTIDMESYKEENGYATFNISFTYSNNKQIKIKTYLAIDDTTVPNIKFGKQE